MSSPPTVLQIFLAALRLGCTSFGGPVAHLGYFQRDYVGRRRWIGTAEFAELVALCQFLPGPASSQTGFGIGYHLRGWPGGIAAWLGFTLPSAVLMIGLALGLARFDAAAIGGGLHGLKLAALAVVAHAVLAMWRSLAPDVPRSALVLACLVPLLLWPSAILQTGIIVFGGAAGWLLFRKDAAAAPNPTAAPDWRGSLGLLAGFGLLLLLLPLLASSGTAPWLAQAGTYYRTGAMVFGGGHVVLPLLERELVTPGGLTADQFLAGYGAAQALPGPLFTFAGYLGAIAGGPLGGGWALLWIFLPGLLLVPAALPLWRQLRGHAGAQAALRGANSAVVGLLAAALITPVGTTALKSSPDILAALAAFAALWSQRVPVWLVVAACAGAGFLLT